MAALQPDGPSAEALLQGPDQGLHPALIGAAHPGQVPGEVPFLQKAAEGLLLKAADGVGVGAEGGPVPLQQVPGQDHAGDADAGGQALGKGAEIHHRAVGPRHALEAGQGPHVEAELRVVVVLQDVPPRGPGGPGQKLGPPPRGHGDGGGKVVAGGDVAQVGPALLQPSCRAVPPRQCPHTGRGPRCSPGWSGSGRSRGSQWPPCRPGGAGPPAPAGTPPRPPPRSVPGRRPPPGRPPGSPPGPGAGPRPPGGGRGRGAPAGRRAAPSGCGPRCGRGTGPCPPPRWPGRRPGPPPPLLRPPRGPPPGPGRRAGPVLRRSPGRRSRSWAGPPGSPPPPASGRRRPPCSPPPPAAGPGSACRGASPPGPAAPADLLRQVLVELLVEGLPCPAVKAAGQIQHDDPSKLIP